MFWIGLVVGWFTAMPLVILVLSMVTLFSRMDKDRP